MKYIAAIFLFAYIFGCNPVEKQNYQLTDEELSLLLFDIHYADVVLPGLSRQQQDSIKIIYYEQLSKIYDMSVEELKKEISKLESEPEKMKIILGRVKQLADSIQ